VLTHVMLDVTSIICKDIFRDLFKEQRGIDPLEPVREEAAPEEPEGEPEGPALPRDHEVIVPDGVVRRLPVPVDVPLAPPAPGLYELHVHISNVFKATVICHKAVLLLGRDPSTDYVDPHGSVSRLHSAVLFSQRAAFLVDLGSTSGTLLNGKTRLVPREPVPLKYGDYFTQGQQSYKQYKLAAPKKSLKSDIAVEALSPNPEPLLSTAPVKKKVVKRKVRRTVVRKEVRKKRKPKASIWEDSDEDGSHEEVDVEVEEDDLDDPPAVVAAPANGPGKESSQAAPDTKDARDKKTEKKKEKGAKSRERAKGGKKEKRPKGDKKDTREKDRPAPPVLPDPVAPEAASNSNGITGPPGPPPNRPPDDLPAPAVGGEPDGRRSTEPKRKTRSRDREGRTGHGERDRDKDRPRDGDRDRDKGGARDRRGHDREGPAQKRRRSDTPDRSGRRKGSR